MTHKKQKFSKLLVTVFLLSTSASAFAPTNFFPSYDPALRLPAASKLNPWRVGANVEWGETKHARNWDGKKANVLSMYDESENMLAMFEQPTAELLANQAFVNMRNQLRINGAFDDGVRGHIKLHGEFEQWDVTPFVHYVLPWDIVPGKLSVRLSLPIRGARISNVRFTDLTVNTHPVADTVTKDLVTGSDALIKNVLAFGGLQANAWDEAGLGDLAFMVEWSKNYPQQRDGLRNVELHAKIGFTAPTGKKRDENKAFSIPFGHDGAWSLPFGLGIDLDFEYTIALGAEAEFEATFDHAKTYRMKTDQFQSSLFQLNKGRATKDHGFLWKFYLYAQSYHFWRGLSLKAAYEYTKHDDDRLHPKDNGFNAGVVNSDRSLAEWNTHAMIFTMNYDFFTCKKFVKPQISLFYKLPLTGKGIINSHTIGGQVAINF